MLLNCNAFHVLDNTVSVCYDKSRKKIRGDDNER